MTPLDQLYALGLDLESAMAADPDDRIVSPYDILHVMVQHWYAHFGRVVGGQFHIVLDDGNYEHTHIRWCMDDYYRRDSTWWTVDNPDPGAEAVVLMGGTLLSFSEQELAVLAWCDWGGISR